MTTLETIIQKRLEEFGTKGGSLPEIEAQLRMDPENEDLKARKEEALRCEEEKIEYLLNVTPFIRKLEEDERVPEVTNATLPDPGGGYVSAGRGLGGFIKETQVSKRSETFAEYMQTIEGKMLDSCDIRAGQDEYICECGHPKYYDTTTSSFVCGECGRTQYCIEMTSRNLTYAEEVAAVSNPSFTYNRINHLCEWLNSIQAKENTEVPEEVVEAVKAEFRKEGTVTRKDIKPGKVRQFLKKLGLSKYYEHTNYITGLLNGVPAPKFPRELEEKFKNMFIATQGPFERHCPPNRKNFLSYAYTLYKFCQLLGEDKYLKHFKLLKSATKLHAQDMMWKAICSDLGWEFIPSV